MILEDAVLVEVAQSLTQVPPHNDGDEVEEKEACQRVQQYFGLLQELQRCRKYR